MKSSSIAVSILAFIVWFCSPTVAVQAQGEPIVLTACLLRDGVVVGYFDEVSGLGSETEVVQQIIVDPSGQQVIRKLPGRLKWQDISLKRGLTTDTSIWDWRKQVEVGDIQEARKDGAIILYNSTFEVVAEWRFASGWPSSITGSFSFGSGAVEELVLVHEGLERVR